VRGLASACRAAALACGVIAAGAGVEAQNPSRPLQMRIVEFSWPLANGAVVPAGATAVTLDRGMGFTMRFQLPGQCDALRDAGERYGVDASPSIRDQYDSARAFCGRARVFALGVPTAPRDFVSRTDFTRLPLDLIPYEVRCVPGASGGVADLCDALKRRDPATCLAGSMPAALSLARFVTQADPTTGRTLLDCRPLRVDASSCHLRASQFSGAIAARSGVVHCDPVPGATAPVTVQLQDVTYRDVNRDGIMDAILSVSAGTRIPATQWVPFVVTRRSAAAPLERLTIE